jgi:hypothetical protein
MSDQLPWGKHYDDADKADKLAAMELANGNQKRAEFWRGMADKKRVDGDRALERQVPKGWIK